MDDSKSCSTDFNSCVIILISGSTDCRRSSVVSLKPLAFEGADPEFKLGRMSIDKQISGDLTASTVGQMLTAMTGTDGSAGYVAIERVVGVLDGKQGTFVLQHSGTMNRGTPSLCVSLVPDSGSEELVGLECEFKIDIVDG